VRRTAISDERIVRADDQSVTFRYTDSATQRPVECTLAADEFMRRYLQHVPPPGQHPVRYFGWMHPAAKRRRILVETLLAALIIVRPASEEPSWHLRCPHCQTFTLVCVAQLPRSPLLFSVKRLRVKLYSRPRLRIASGAGRSDADVSQYSIQKPSNRVYALRSTVIDRLSGSNQMGSIHNFAREFRRPVFSRQIQSA